MGNKNLRDLSAPYLAMIAINFVFAVVNVLLKLVLQEGMDHSVLITYRLFVSAAFLAPIGYFRERGGDSKLTFRVLCYLLSSSFGVSLTQYLFLYGLERTSPTFAMGFVNMVPVITFLMALPLRMETVDLIGSGGRAKILGSMVCISGAMTMIIYRGRTLFNPQEQQSLPLVTDGRKGGGGWIISSMSLLLGTIAWSSWFLIQNNIGMMYPRKYSSTAIVSSFAAAQSAVVSFLLSGRETKLSVWILKGQIEIITVLFSGMVGSGLCYVGMSWCVKKRGPLFTSAFSPLIQIMAAMIDIPFLHDQLHLGSLLGSLLVIVGLYIMLWGKSRDINDHEVAAEGRDTDKASQQTRTEGPTAGTGPMITSEV
ncbi:hypothetical protein MLD38_016620 [Melastoma candidum]|uniref:Uncharacterized protein n=1 Tax=Melastoma candidum TaxID=119954 RepID=A0ACB9QN22_9MYRT|nr:hypothetical protein MLD38_016620 [Melastoma candidum]